MLIETLDTATHLDNVHSNWDRVYDADPEAQYFLSWEWIRNWVDTLPDSWFVLAAKVSETSPDFVAFFPLRRSVEIDHEGRFAHSLRMAGSYFAVYTGLLCDPQFEEEALDAFVAHVLALNWAEFHLDDLALSSARQQRLFQAFSSAGLSIEKKQRVKLTTAAGERINHDVYVVIDLEDDWDRFLATRIGSKTRRDARNFLRKVDREEGSRVEVSDRSNIKQNMEILAELWNIQWRDNNERYANFITWNIANFLTKLIPYGNMFVPVLWHEETPVGAHIYFLDERKKTIVCFLVGRDLQARKPPPGFVLHMYAIRWAILNGYRSFDFGTGNFSYKYRFGSREHLVERFCISTADGENLRGPVDRTTLPLALAEVGRTMRSGQLGAATRACETVLSFDPGNALARNLLDDIASTRRAAAQLVAKAFTRHKAKQFAEAGALCEAALTQDNTNFAARHMLGLSLYQRGDLAAAERNLRLAVDLDPADAPAHNNLAGVLIGLGRLSEALDSYEDALACDPDYEQARSNRAKLLEKIASSDHPAIGSPTSDGPFHTGSA